MSTSRFKAFDIYPKTIEDFKVKTLTGGAISLISIAIVLVLVFSEVMYYLEVDRVDELYVDTSLEMKMPIYINVTFPAISCDALNLDLMDVSGDFQLNIEHTVFKQRLALDGTYIDDKLLVKDVNAVPKDEAKAVAAKKTQAADYCGSCYGGETFEQKCCNTCEEVRESYRKRGWAFTPSDDIEQCYTEILERKMRYAKHEGCNLHGHFMVNKVAGNFHVAPGKSFIRAHTQIHDYTPYELDHFNTSHIIHSLGFGVEYPGIQNPLDGTNKMIPEGSGLFQYFIKVVPTIYEYNDGQQIVTNQYSVTQHFRPKNEFHEHVVPGVFFMYDLSPIMVHIAERSRSFIHFLTSLCAIIGGVFTVAGIVDAFIYNVSKIHTKQSIIE
ncbi:endoplasmic reticulum-golgi intermediate compartment protein [Acrasis kona]|uniref:Endoplasmic reticulum-golgi intermediate compartment protein n=1 Tax=Acrasis kona TaxID=1008807 RepID=A0AAW2ZGJ2_9EUKA